jgi:hypothetical protein
LRAGEISVRNTPPRKPHGDRGAMQAKKLQSVRRTVAAHVLPRTQAPRTIARYEQIEGPRTSGDS